MCIEHRTLYAFNLLEGTTLCLEHLSHSWHLQYWQFLEGFDLG